MSHNIRQLLCLIGLHTWAHLYYGHMSRRHLLERYCCVRCNKMKSVKLKKEKAYV